MASPVGFEYTTRSNGDVAIKHHGKQAAILRGRIAQKFLVDIDMKDPQELMARVTGDYKRGNERR